MEWRSGGAAAAAAQGCGSWLWRQGGGSQVQLHGASPRHSMTSSAGSATSRAERGIRDLACVLTTLRDEPAVRCCKPYRCFEGRQPRRTEPVREMATARCGAAPGERASACCGMWAAGSRRRPCALPASLINEKCAYLRLECHSLSKRVQAAPTRCPMLRSQRWAASSNRTGCNCSRMTSNQE